jgi:hypothetical protein
MRPHDFRHSLLLICASLLCVCLIGCQSPSSERWLILERTSRPDPEIVSVVRELPTHDTRRQFPVLLEVRWGYKGLPNGLPTEDELIFARTLYTGLDGIVANNGIHAMTRTGDGGRTMYYYVDDPAKLQDAIRKFFDAQPPMSVKVTARDDRDWNTVREVLSATRR